MFGCVVEQAGQLFIANLSIGASFDEAAIDPSGASGHIRVREDPGQSAGELLGAVDVEEEASPAVIDPIPVGADTRDDWKEAAGHRLEQR